MKWQEPRVIMDDGWAGSWQKAKYIWGHPDASDMYRDQWKELDKKYGTKWANGIGKRPDDVSIVEWLEE